MILSTPTAKAAALTEALPYLQKFRGQTFVIKMGGSAMENPELVKEVMRDIVFLEVAGINPIVVHGGGKAISAAMEKSGLEAQFIGGFRVTSPEAIEIVEQTLSNELNPSLVNMLNEHEGKAKGLSGRKVFQAQRIQGKNEEGQLVDIGRVGECVNCLTQEIEDFLSQEIVPVISPLGNEIGTHKALNINADLAAAALAKSLAPAKLIYISDVPGLLSDPSNPESLIQSINRQDAENLIVDGTISGGMIPKITSAIDALNAGVQKAHFIDGRIPHTLLLEIFTKSGIGTEVTL